MSTRGSVSRSTRSPTRSVGKTSSHASLLKRKMTAFGSSFGLKGVLFAAAREEGVSRFGTTYPFLFSCSTILYEITSEPEDEELDQSVRASCHTSARWLSSAAVRAATGALQTCTGTLILLRIAQRGPAAGRAVLCVGDRTVGVHQAADAAEAAIGTPLLQPAVPPLDDLCGGGGGDRPDA